MKIKKLSLKNFRCYDDLNIEFEDKLTVIVGENGKGKSAIFDGIVVGLASYLDAFGGVVRKLKKTDVRRVPIYDASNKNIVSMDKKLPVTFTLEAEAEGKALESKISYDGKDTSYEQDDFVKFAEEKKAAALEDKATILPALAYYGTSRIWVDSNLLKEKEID